MATGFGIFSVVSTAFSAFSSKTAADKAARTNRNLSRANRIQYLKETKELIRRTSRSQNIREGNIRGQAYASGFAKGSSLDRYVDSVVTEQIATLNWMSSSRADVSKLQAKEESARFSIAKNINNAGLISGVFGAIGQASSLPETYQKYGWGFTAKK